MTIDPDAPAVKVAPDEERCFRCGSWYLDTGWECNDCGFDNYHLYAPAPKAKL
jgi:hypothetical protein